MSTEATAKTSIALSSVANLKSITEWKKWSIGINEWIIDHDLDVPGPTEPLDLEAHLAQIPAPTAAQTRTHTAAVIAYTAYLRKQFKGVNSLKSTCGDRAKGFVDALPDPKTIDTAMAVLEANFKPTAEANLETARSDFNAVCLAGSKNVDEYTTQFNDKYAELAALNNVLPESELIAKFINGLGVAFTTWTTSFRLARSLSLMPMTLSQVQNLAKNEETGMNNTPGIHGMTAAGHHLSPQMPVNRGRGGYHGRDYRGDSGENANRWCDSCQTPYHWTSMCRNSNPELMATWRKENPERAALQDARKALDAKFPDERSRGRGRGRGGYRRRGSGQRDRQRSKSPEPKNADSGNFARGDVPHYRV